MKELCLVRLTAFAITCMLASVTFSSWAVPQIPAQGDPKVEVGFNQVEAVLPSEPTGLPASDVHRQSNGHGRGDSPI
jgi:hypothetical protein